MVTCFVGEKRDTIRVLAGWRNDEGKKLLREGSNEGTVTAPELGMHVVGQT